MTLKLTMTKFTLAILPVLLIARDEQATSRTYATTPDKAYVGEVIAMNAAITSSVKEACMVTFREDIPPGNIITGVLLCREASDGTKITLSYSLKATKQVVFLGKVKTKFENRVWAALDAELGKAIHDN